MVSNIKFALTSNGLENNNWLLLEGSLQHEVLFEYEMCRGLIKSWKLMDPCWLRDYSQLCTHDYSMRGDFFLLLFFFFCHWNNLVLIVSSRRHRDKQKNRKTSSNECREQRTRAAVNEWDIVVDILQFKQAILPSRVQVDKSVSVEGQATQIQVTVGLDSAAPQLAWTSSRTSYYILDRFQASGLSLPSLSAHSPATAGRTSSWHRATQL